MFNRYMEQQEHDKCPSNKTKEKEIESLHEKTIQNNHSKNDPNS